MANLKCFLLLLSGLLLTGCLAQKENTELLHELKGEVFGSYYLIKYRGQLDPDEFSKELNNFFASFNYEFSTYQENSIISSFNKAPMNTKLKVSERFIEMLKLAQKFYQESEGIFDPTLGPVIKAWGFGGGKKKRIPSKAELKLAMDKVGFLHVKWDEKALTVWKTKDLELDVNAFAPGWACDLIGSLLMAHSVQDFMVDISGEILFKGMKSADHPWIAGIEKPSKKYAEGVQLALKMKNYAISTSGSYRQYFDEDGSRKTHIIDPKTGHPVTHSISSASVISPTAVEAHAWSTVMMVLGQEGIELARKNGMKVFLLRAVKQNEFEEIISPEMKSFIEANHL